MRIDQLVEQVSSWDGVSAHSHRFGGTEFRLGNAEIGHVHTGGVVDIPFPRSIRDALLEDHLAEEHHWVPNSGWTTFRMRSEPDLNHALWLMRLSYLRYALKRAANAKEVFETEAEQLRLSPRFKSLLEPFIRKSGNQTSAQPLSA
jgi:luciferase-like monooxygenase